MVSAADRLQLQLRNLQSSSFVSRRASWSAAFKTNLNPALNCTVSVAVLRIIVSSTSATTEVFKYCPRVQLIDVFPQLSSWQLHLEPRLRAVM
jgi:hypothetical protein